MAEVLSRKERERLGPEAGKIDAGGIWATEAVVCIIFDIYLVFQPTSFLV
jgi:hypothetical protein